MLKNAPSNELASLLQFNTNKTDGKTNQIVDNLINHVLPNFTKLSIEVEAVQDATKSAFEFVLSKHFMTDNGTFKWKDFEKVIEIEQSGRARSSAYVPPDAPQPADADAVAGELASMRVDG